MIRTVEIAVVGGTRISLIIDFSSDHRSINDLLNKEALCIKSHVDNLGRFFKNVVVHVNGVEDQRRLDAVITGDECRGGISVVARRESIRVLISPEIDYSCDAVCNTDDVESEIKVG